MSDELNGAPAIGWSLRREGYVSPGGKNMQPKHSRLMVVGHYLIIGEGVLSEKRMRYKVEKHYAHDRARALALRHTALRERQGYVLHNEPKVLAVNKEGMDEFLDRLAGGPAVTHKGLHDSFVQLFHKGTLLSEKVSPTVSPAA